MDIKKLNGEQKRRLGELIALNELISDYLELLKTDLRELTEEEETTLNANNYFNIKRTTDKRSKIVNDAYNKELEELKRKYNDYKVETVRENYKIQYSATSTSKSLANEIISNILGLTQKDLQEAVKAVCK